MANLMIGIAAEIRKVLDAAVPHHCFVGVVSYETDRGYEDRSTYPDVICATREEAIEEGIIRLEMYLGTYHGDIVAGQNLVQTPEFRAYVANYNGKREDWNWPEDKAKAVPELNDDGSEVVILSCRLAKTWMRIYRAPRPDLYRNFNVQEMAAASL